MTLALVVLGGAIGAPLRYLTDLLVQSRHDSVYPWGTFIVNVFGSALLGLVAGGVVMAGAPPWLLALVGTGFCGALTTFSTFGFETVRLIEDGSVGEAFLNAGLSLIVGLAAASAGWAVAGLAA
jgi:CrcB protein